MSDEDPTLADLMRNAIRTRDPRSVVSEYVLERVPHDFGDDWPLYRNWRQYLASRIGVDPCNISLTGSACVGVSLNPHKHFAEFDARSDVDVAVNSP
jgi:hypothetical protein